MKSIIDVLGQEVEAEFFDLRYGVRVDAIIEIGGQRRFFRARSNNAGGAVANLKAQARNARDAYATKHLRQAHGLRLVKG
jgi:hypothetical protein